MSDTETNDANEKPSFVADFKLSVDISTGEWTIQLGKVDPLHERMVATTLISKIIKRKPDYNSLKSIAWSGVDVVNLTLPYGK